jgi:hypothetical protein
MINHNQLLETMKTLPFEFEIEDLFERVILINNIEEGIKDADSGKVIEMAELENRAKLWFE